MPRGLAGERDKLAAVAQSEEERIAQLMRAYRVTEAEAREMLPDPESEAQVVSEDLSSSPVVTVRTLFNGFDQAYARWQVVEYAPYDAAAAFIPLFEVLEWAACIDERLAYIDWSKDLRGLRWARNRSRHDWAMALEVLRREQLRLPDNVDRNWGPEFEWAWRETLPERTSVAARYRKDEPYYQSNLAGQPARVTINMVHAFFHDLPTYDS